MKAALLAALFTLDGDLPRIQSLETAPTAFQELYLALRDAVEDRQIAPIYAALGAEFVIERDFGGVYLRGAAAVTNFSAIFQLNPDKLREGYKDEGWQRLANRLVETPLEWKTSGELCTNYGGMESEPFPTGQLCFRFSGGRWQMARYIKGGD